MGNLPAGRYGSGVTLDIRPATDSDAERIAGIWNDGWADGHLGNVPDELVPFRTPEFFRRRTLVNLPTTLVADLDGVVAGFVVVLDDELDQVYVAPEFRGQGIADAVLRAGERSVAEAGHRDAWLAVVPGNARARRFYERNGWVDGGEFAFPAPIEDGTIDVPCRRYVKPLLD